MKCRQKAITLRHTKFHKAIFFIHWASSSTKRLAGLRDACWNDMKNYCKPLCCYGSFCEGLFGRSTLIKSWMHKTRTNPTRKMESMTTAVWKRIPSVFLLTLHKAMVRTIGSMINPMHRLTILQTSDAAIINFMF